MDVPCQDVETLNCCLSCHITARANARVAILLRALYTVLQVQQAIVVLMDHTLKELRGAAPLIDSAELTVENCIFHSFDRYGRPCTQC